MMPSRFKVEMTCACATVTHAEIVLARPGGIAPLSCSCGRSFVMQQLEESEVTRIAVDPLGITGGLVPEDVELPKVH